MTTPDASAAASAAANPFVEFTAAEASRYMLQSMARPFKGIDPVVDARIDAAAAQIMGMPGIRTKIGRAHV